MASKSIKAARPYPHYKFPHEIIIECRQLSVDECMWFNVPLGSYQLRCTNSSWFPTECIMGTIKGKFTDTLQLGATISGNMGSASIAVKDKDKAIQLLKSKGYKVQPA